jgi:hypothetical protein
LELHFGKDVSLRVRSRTLLFVVRVYLVFLIYLQVGLMLAMSGVSAFPWTILTVGPRLFADQSIIFALAVLGLLGMYLVNSKGRIESQPPTAKTD